MSSLLRVSEAASLALHTMVLLAARNGARVSAPEMARRLRASEAHLSKVLQRLAHVGLVTSVRGPRGGFSLSRPAGSITLLEVYEAIEGPLQATKCLAREPVCGGRRCLLGGLVGDINTRVRRYLANTRLSELDDIYGALWRTVPERRVPRRGEARAGEGAPRDGGQHVKTQRRHQD
jgi:Rrf2 family protein